MSVGAELAQSSRSSEDQEVPSTVEEEFLKEVLESLQQAVETGEPVALTILAGVV